VSSSRTNYIHTNKKDIQLTAEITKTEMWKTRVEGLKGNMPHLCRWKRTKSQVARGRKCERESACLSTFEIVPPPLGKTAF